SHRQHGRFSIRDLDLLAGEIQPVAKEPKPDPAQIDAAFKAVPLDELKSLQTSVDGALTSIRAIDEGMRGSNGSEFAPSYDGLSTQFKKMAAVLRTQIAARPDVAVADAPAEGEATGQPGGAAMVAVGSIRSREDALRALDAASEFFKRN